MYYQEYSEYLLHNPYKEQDESLVYHSYYNSKKEVFIASSGHQHVWYPGVLQDAARIARDSQGTAMEEASFLQRCLRELEFSQS